MRNEYRSKEPYSPKKLRYCQGLRLSTPQHMALNTENIVISVPPQIQQIAEINRTEKQVLAQIMHLDSSDKGCFATNKYLAKALDLSERHIQKIIRKLKDLGLLSISIMNRCFRRIFCLVEKVKKKILEQAKENAVPPDRRRFAYNKKKENIFNSYAKKITIDKFQKEKESREEFDAYCNEREATDSIRIRRHYNNQSETIAASSWQQLKAKILNKFSLNA